VTTTARANREAVRKNHDTKEPTMTKNKDRRGMITINTRGLTSIERKSDGTLPRLTARQRQAVVRLINICSNYNNGNCVLLDNGENCICPQSISYSINCKFFRNVLLEDKEGLSLKAELFRDDSIKKCLIFGNRYKSVGNRAKYCDNCKGNVQRKQKAEYASRRRSIVEK
jgi:hypothetical protein